MKLKSLWPVGAPRLVMLNLCFRRQHKESVQDALLRRRIDHAAPKRQQIPIAAYPTRKAIALATPGSYVAKKPNKQNAATASRISAIIHSMIFILVLSVFVS
jgi:hypothetical protein